MNITLNAMEVFEIAEEIERNGERFYRDSAKRVQDPVARKVLQDLADLEREHLMIFKKLQAQLDERYQEEPIWDPDDEAKAYLQAAGDSHVFKVGTDLSELLPNNSDSREVLEMGLQFEKDTIAYLLGLSDMVPERLGKTDVLNLVKQEQGHIVLIGRILSDL